MKKNFIPWLLTNKDGLAPLAVWIFIQLCVIWKWSLFKQDPAIGLIFELVITAPVLAILVSRHKEYEKEGGKNGK